jgi:hypothetical protein
VRIIRIRIIRIVVFSFIDWASGTAQIVPQQVPWRAKIAEPGYMRGVVVLPASQLSADLAEEIGRMALEEGAERDLVHVDIYSEEDFPPFHYLMLSHIGYDWWWMNFQKAIPYPIGRTTKLGHKAVVEFRDRRGIVTRKVLSGADPLDVATAGGDFRLLHFNFRPIPLAREKGWLVRDRLDVFAKTDHALEPASGKILLELLHRLIPSCEIMLYIRNDTWFLDTSGFVLEYPFQAKQAPPTKEDFVSTWTLVCGGLTAESYDCHSRHGQ